MIYGSIYGSCNSNVVDFQLDMPNSRVFFLELLLMDKIGFSYKGLY